MAATAESFFTSDAALASNDAAKAAFAKYSKAASDAVIEKTKAALEKKNHAVTVVADKAAALAALIDLIPEGVTIHNTSSTTLNQIGFVEHMKTSTKWDNLHAKVLAEKDQAKAADLRRQAQAAQYAISSVDAVTEDGDFAVADASGTRIAVVHAAGKVVFVIGANKLVPTIADAEDRIRNYCFQIESARVRAAYGWPSSNVSNLLVVHTHGLMPAKFHFIIVKESLGF